MYVQVTNVEKKFLVLQPLLGMGNSQIEEVRPNQICLTCDFLIFPIFANPLQSLVTARPLPRRGEGDSPSPPYGILLSFSLPVLLPLNLQTHTFTRAHTYPLSQMHAHLSR